MVVDDETFLQSVSCFLQSVYWCKRKCSYNHSLQPGNTDQEANSTDLNASKQRYQQEISRLHRLLTISLTDIINKLRAYKDKKPFTTETIYLYLLYLKGHTQN